MKNLIRRCAIAAAAGCAALVSTSCYYDPAVYGSTGYVASAPPSNYSYGFGAGYGYGHPRFSTSFFVSTGDPRWGYDPYSYSYFDYVSHRYYDPHLHGYYPYGYRPRIIYGVPHVYGYRRGYAPPPRYVRDRYINGYRDRVGAYRRGGFDWGRNVGWERPRPNVIGSRPSRDEQPGRPGFGNRPGGFTNPPFVQGNRPPTRGGIVAPSRGNSSRYQSPPRRGYNTPITSRGNSNWGNRNPYGDRNFSGSRDPRSGAVNRGNPMGSRPQMGGRSAPQRQQSSAPYGNRGRSDGENQNIRRF